MGEGILIFSGKANVGMLALAIMVLTVLAGVLLCFGLFTRCAAAVAALGTIGSLSPWSANLRSGLFESRSTAVLLLVIAAAVASAGPGAFSTDARIFGRREVIIPDKPSDTRV